MPKPKLAEEEKGIRVSFYASPDNKNYLRNNKPPHFSRFMNGLLDNHRVGYSSDLNQIRSDKTQINYIKDLMDLFIKCRGAMRTHPRWNSEDLSKIREISEYYNEVMENE